MTAMTDTWISLVREGAFWCAALWEDGELVSTLRTGQLGELPHARTIITRDDCDDIRHRWTASDIAVPRAPRSSDIDWVALSRRESACTVALRAGQDDIYTAFREAIALGQHYAVTGGYGEGW